MGSWKRPLAFLSTPLVAALALLGACTFLRDPDALSRGGGTPGDGAPADAAPSDSPGNPLDGPSCGQGLVCAVSPPLGWKFVTLAPVMPPEGGILTPCPNGYMGGGTLHEGYDAGPFGCTCQCSGTPSPVCVGSGANTAIELSTNSTCASPISTNINTDGFCGVATISLAGSGFASIVPAPPFDNSCFAEVMQTPTNPVLTYGANWSLCIVQVDPLQGDCASGSVCARQAPPPYDVCVASPGDVPCPTTYPVRHPLFTQVFDDRSCMGNCSCGVTGVSCTNASVTLYKMSCGAAQSVVLTADGNCDPYAATSGTYSYYRYTATLSGGTGTCVVVDGGPEAGAFVTGTTNTTGLETVCCP